MVVRLFGAYAGDPAPGPNVELTGSAGFLDRDGDSTPEQNVPDAAFSPFQLMFPAPPGQTPGAIGKQWSQVEVRQQNGIHESTTGERPRNRRGRIESADPPESGISGSLAVGGTGVDDPCRAAAHHEIGPPSRYHDRQVQTPRSGPSPPHRAARPSTRCGPAPVTALQTDGDISIRRRWPTSSPPRRQATRDGIERRSQRMQSERRGRVRQPHQHRAIVFVARQPPITPDRPRR